MLVLFSFDFLCHLDISAVDGVQILLFIKLLFGGKFFTSIITLRRIILVAFNLAVIKELQLMLAIVFVLSVCGALLSHAFQALRTRFFLSIGRHLFVLLNPIQRLQSIILFPLNQLFLIHHVFSFSFLCILSESDLTVSQIDLLPHSFFLFCEKFQAIFKHRLFSLLLL